MLNFKTKSPAKVIILFDRFPAKLLQSSSYSKNDYLCLFRIRV